MWEGYIVAQFLITPPPPAKVYADLNPVWGKFGNIVIHPMPEDAYLIYIPNKSTRDWVVQIGYWQSDNCSIVVSEWTPNGSLKPEKLHSVPTWVRFSNIPPKLYSIEGINVIASAVGEPMHTETSRLNAFFSGTTKVKVEIPLNRKRHEHGKNSVGWCKGVSFPSGSWIVGILLETSIFLLLSSLCSITSPAGLLGAITSPSGCPGGAVSSTTTDEKSGGSSSIWRLRVPPTFADLLYSLSSVYQEIFKF